MDLWIRSQDKENLIKVNNINLRNDNSNKRGLQITVNEDWLIIAEYKSKDRALEVLYEIDKHKQKLDYLELMRLVPCLKNSLYEEMIDFMNECKFTYEMPKD